MYVHRITRPLNKAGITRYGEVTLSRGADLLELRTIKANGEIIEPELDQQKPTISMPALEPGDAIEEEYVLHYADLEQVPENAAAHTFGSFAAPILHSRFVLLDPPDAAVRVRQQAGLPLPLVGENNGMVVKNLGMIQRGTNRLRAVSARAVNLAAHGNCCAAEKTIAEVFGTS